MGRTGHRYHHRGDTLVFVFAGEDIPVNAPREVRMRRAGRAVAVLVAGGFAASLFFSFLRAGNGWEAALSLGEPGRLGLWELLPLAIGCAAVLTTYAFWKWRWLLRRGTLTGGAVTEVEEEYDADNERTVSYHYAYEEPDRGRFTGRLHPFAPNGLVAGDTIPVFFDPARPKRHLIYVRPLLYQVLPQEGAP